MKKRTLFTALMMMLTLTLTLPASAMAYDAYMQSAWLKQFAQALESLVPINNPAETADPARSGQVLLAYEFGTVLANQKNPAAEDILEIEIRTDQVTDCRGVHVGMDMYHALGGCQIASSATQLYVLDTQNAGWSWAYLQNGSIYGAEYIAYGDAGAGLKEYTLTYVIDNGKIIAVRLKMADATQAQAQEGIMTAREIASRQHGETLAMANHAPMFSQNDLNVNGGAALGRPVHELIARMGEPLEVQTLPEGKGRILIYNGAAVRLELDERTGVEVVRGISVTNEQTAGPNGLLVGLGVQEAASLFFCEADVSSAGGELYLGGESFYDPPYGLLSVSGEESMLIYACMTDSNETAKLEAGISDGVVSYWHLYYQSDAEGGV